MVLNFLATQAFLALHYFLVFHLGSLLLKCQAHLLVLVDLGNPGVLKVLVTLVFLAIHYFLVSYLDSLLLKFQAFLFVLVGLRVPVAL